MGPRAPQPDPTDLDALAAQVDRLHQGGCHPLGQWDLARTCWHLATTMDLLPTFALLAGQNISHDVDGHDVRSLILGESEAASPYEAFYYFQMDQLQAVRSGRWKLFLPLSDFVHHPHFSKGETAIPLLFDVVEDVGSQRNVADQHPRIVEQLSQLAETARQDLGDKGRPGRGQRSAGVRAGRTPQPLMPAD